MIRIYIVIFKALILTLVSISANAENWKLITKDGADEYLLDTDSIAYNKSVRNIYILRNMPKEATIRSTVSKYKISCESGSYAVDNIQGYGDLDSKGRIYPSPGGVISNVVEKLIITEACLLIGAGIKATIEIAPTAASSNLYKTPTANSNAASQPSAGDDNNKTSSEITNIKQTISVRNLPKIRAGNSNKSNEIAYYIPLQFYNPKLGNYRDACQFDLNAAGKIFQQYKLEAPYEFPISVAKNLIDDIRLDWDNKVTFGSSLLTQLVTKIPVCIVQGDIYLSEIYASEWMQLEEEYNIFKPNSAECLRQGMNFKRLPYYLSRMGDGTKYPSIHHPIAEEVIASCKKIVESNPGKNIECTVGDTKRKTKCDENWYETRNNQNYKLSGVKDIVEASLAGKSISIMSYETVQADAEFKNLVAMQEQARIKKAEEEDNRRKWLATPEGKKYLADEAARSKKAQEDQARKDAQERVNRAKEFPLYALISCTINGQHTTIYACFGGDVDTEIELKNGSQYGLYKSYQFQSLGRETREGFAIDLRSSFQLKAQNSSESLILGVKIIDRVSNKVRFEKQVSRFGVIRIGS